MAMEQQNDEGHGARKGETAAHIWTWAAVALHCAESAVADATPD
jgi:hypothetical protein